MGARGGGRARTGALAHTHTRARNIGLSVGESIDFARNPDRCSAPRASSLDAAERSPNGPERSQTPAAHHLPKLANQTNCQILLCPMVSRRRALCTLREASLAPLALARSAHLALLAPHAGGISTTWPRLHHAQPKGKSFTSPFGETDDTLGSHTSLVAPTPIHFQPQSPNRETR